MINSEIENYAWLHTTDESDAIAKLIEKSDHELEHIDMLSGKIVGRLLAILVRISGAKRILEVGTFTGYSALHMAEALPEDGSIITCEYNQRYKTIADQAFQCHKDGYKITLKMGPALETIPSLNGSFDFIFLDADKINYINYYKALIPKLSQGGIMVIDNVLWGGSVIEHEDEKSGVIHNLNQLIADDESVEQVMLTVRDGITIVRKI